VKKARLVRRGLAVLILIYAGWIAFQAATFKRYGAGPAMAAADALGIWEAEGVYHAHTKFSDGRGTPETIAAAAAGNGLDFVILTDHGAPNQAGLTAQGRRRGLLLLAGCEISSSRGHLVALGFDPSGKPFSPEAEMAAAEVVQRGGFTVIAHPYSKTHWSWGPWAGYGGIEIFNGDTTVKRRPVRTLLNLPLLLLRPEAALLPLLEPPAAETGKWDRLAAAHPLYAFFAADAHFAYKALFTLFHLHVLLDAPLPDGFEEARARIFEALKAGRFYNAVEAAAAARGFRFQADAGGEVVPMGGRIPPGAGPVRFAVRAPFAFAHETRLLRDGLEIARSSGPELTAAAAGPGVYRVEVFLRERSPLDPRVPWILSNPIFLPRTTP
jgi:hypothetical protein